MPVLPLVASMTVWPGLSCPLGLFDHAERQTIFDRAERIECLDLGIEIDAVRREPVDLDDRSIADGFQDVLKFGHVSLLQMRSLCCSEASGIAARAPAGPGRSYKPR
jgi:hypothetical protein